MALGALAPIGLYLIAVSWFAQRIRGDGYDGVGFVLSLSQLDLTRFQPQPPGYPLLVALGRLIHACGLSRGVALAVISAVLWGSGISALAAAIGQVAGRLSGRLCAALLTLAPLSLALGTATLSDGAGLGTLLCAIGLVVQPGRMALRAGGFVIGLAIGLRPSYAPLALCILILLGLLRGLGSALCATIYAMLSTLIWLIPFSIIVGARTLWETSRAHLFGHLQIYGGSIATDSAFGSRIGSLLTALGEATFGPLGPASLPLIGVALWSMPPSQMRPTTRRLLAYLLSLFGLYVLWVFVMLPVGGHGRHLLPAVAILSCGLAVLFGEVVEARRGQLTGKAFVICGLGLLVALGASSMRAMWLFRQPSPGMALADYVTDHYPRGTLLYGASAARYLDLVWGSGSAHQTLYFGDVIVEAERMNHLPEAVLLTSEVQASPERLLRPLARFCYDPRLPLVLRLESYPAGCVELRAYRLRR